MTVPALVTRNVTVPRGTVARSDLRPIAPGCIGPLPSPIGPPESVRVTLTTGEDEPGPVRAGPGSVRVAAGVALLPADFPGGERSMRVKAIVAEVTRTMTADTRTATVVGRFRVITCQHASSRDCARCPRADRWWPGQS